MFFRRILAISMVLLSVSGMALAQATTEPSTQPAASVGSKFPTPNEMIEKLKQRRIAEQALTKVAYINLNKAITEKPAAFSLLGSNDSHTLRDVLNRLHGVRDDKAVRAVLITLGAEAQMNFAQAQEIRDVLLEIRRAGKKTFVYADSFDTVGYTLACGATDVCLPQGGEIMIPGVGMEAMFYKGVFDKVGVIADYVQIGEYKGAEEPFTRTAASEELKGELHKLSESLFTQIVEGISLSRNMSTQSVRQMIDDAMMTAVVAKDRGFIDHLVEMDGLRGLLKEELGNDVDLIRDYGEKDKPEVDLSNPFTLLASLAKKPEPTTKPEIAVIHVDGVITDGDASGSLLSEDGVGSDPMRRSLRIVARDENIKALVLRIDSPGGSALASEMIWQAIRRVSKETHKPIIISIGSMAASGGYYIASAGDYIFSDRCGIVGSIGVVGGKFVLKDLFDKVGLSTEAFTQGRNADLFSSNQPFTDRQRRMVRTWMQQTYDQFTQRVMTTRQGKIQDIDKVARGRVFLAQQAKELGMVDELGGCDAALAYAAKQAGLQTDGYDLRMLPAPKTILDFLNSKGDEAMSPIQPKITISADSFLLGLAPELRQSAMQQFQLMQLLQKRPVALIAPFVVSVK